MSQTMTDAAADTTVDELRAANLTCASGNCMEAAPAPAPSGPPAAAPATPQGMRPCSSTLLAVYLNS